MHISSLGLSVRQRKIVEPGQEVANEILTESESEDVQINSDARDISLVESGGSSITSKNFLSRDIEIRGSITVRENLFVDGRVDGEINSTGELTVGENAEIQGQIRANSATIFGKIGGNVTADDYCELKAQSVLQGDLKASRLVMEEGASFIGNSEIIPSRVVVNLPQVNTQTDIG